MLRITVNAGHGPRKDGSYDPGAIGPTGKHEAKQNMDISKRLTNKLVSNGHNVQLVHNGDLGVVTKLSNDFKSDYFISVHANGSVYESATGVSAFAYAPGGYGERMAQAIAEELAQATGLRNRGAKIANFHVLRETDAPAVLVEAGFITNPKTEIRMRKDSFDEKVAEAIAVGFSKAVGVEYITYENGGENMDIYVWYFGKNDEVAASYVANLLGGQAYRRDQYEEIEGLNIIVGGSEIIKKDHINLTGADWVETTEKVTEFMKFVRFLKSEEGGYLRWKDHF